jgi:hypothetical protein
VRQNTPNPQVGKITENDPEPEVEKIDAIRYFRNIGYRNGHDDNSLNLSREKGKGDRW